MIQIAHQFFWLRMKNELKKNNERVLICRMQQRTTSSEKYIMFNFHTMLCMKRYEIVIIHCSLGDGVCVLCPPEIYCMQFKANILNRLCLSAPLTIQTAKRTQFYKSQEKARHQRIQYDHIVTSVAN